MVLILRNYHYLLNKLLPLVAFSVLLLAPLGDQNAFAGPVFDDKIFDNGGVAPITDGGPGINNPSGTPFTAAEDFVLDGDFFVTDIHFVVNGDPANFDMVSFQFFILSDNGGEPGNILASGNAMDLEVEPVPSTLVANVWFNLDIPFEAKEGVTYWFALHETNVVGSGIGWTRSSTNTGQGAELCQSAVVPPNPPANWSCDSGHVWFLLSGNEIITDPVGGESLTIDSTALLLAAAQSPVSWLATLTIAALGIGAYVFTRNPNNMRNIKVILRDYLDRI